MKIYLNIKKYCFVFLSIFFISCGGGGGGGSSPSSSSSNTKFSTGVFFDDLTQGLKYSCVSNKNSYTSEKGEFFCKTNETVKFYIDNTYIGEVLFEKDNQTITPYDLWPNNVSLSTKVAQFIQSLGIKKIVNNQNILQLFSLPLDSSLPSSIEDVDFINKLSTFLISDSKSLVDETTARNIMDENIVDKLLNELSFNLIKEQNDSMNNIKTNLNLFSAYEQDTLVTWNSSDVGLISNNGFITRPSLSSGKKEVILNFTLTKGTISKSSFFTLELLPSEERPLLTILVDFVDIKIQNSNDDWSRTIYSKNEGNLNHYFIKNSYGKFSYSKVQESSEVLNDGIIKINSSYSHPGYDNSISYRNDFDKILKEILIKTDDYIDFSLYNKNNDNELSSEELQIIFIFAGGEAANADSYSSSIWAHSSYLLDADSPILDNLKILGINQKYGAFGEKHGNNFATIGIIAHELGHASFDLPDLYDRNGNSSGIGVFGLMGGGSWTAKRFEYSGSTPVHMSAYSKLKADFIEAQIDKKDESIKFYGTNHSLFNILKIQTNNSGEYFLLENRQAAGYDLGLYYLDGISYSSSFKGGLAIWHINENVSNNDDFYNKLVSLEEANNSILFQNNQNGHLKNLFYFGNQDVFSSYSSPNSNLSNGNSSMLDISNISEAKEIMTIDIR